MRFGSVKVYAHRFLKGQPVPVFRDRAVNRAIHAHEGRILRAQTFRRKTAKGGGRAE